MKAITGFFAGVVASILLIVLAGCNQQILDTTYSFREVDVKMADGTVISGKLKSWMDYEDSDAIQVDIEGYGTYYTHMSNVWLHNPE